MPESGGRRPADAPGRPRPAGGASTAGEVRPNGGGLRSFLGYQVISTRRYFKVTFTSQLGAPLLYMLSLGVGLGHLVDKNSGPSALGVGYLAFIAPALVASTALQVATVEATFPVIHGFKWGRVYYAMTSTPLTPAQVARGTLTWIAIRAAVGATLHLVVIAAFGAFRSPAALLTLPFATLGAMAFAAPVAAYAAAAESPSGFNVVFRFLVMPMFLFSGTFYSIDLLPQWAQWAAWVSPLWHATELCRWVSLGPAHLSSGVGSLSGGAVAIHVAFLTVLTVAGLLVTARRFRTRLTK